MSLAARLLPIPLFCLGFLFISGVVLFIFLKNMANTLRQSTQKIEELEKKVPPNDGLESLLKEETKPGFACPACGGEVPAGASACPYCGKKV